MNIFQSLCDKISVDGFHSEKHFATSPFTGYQLNEDQFCTEIVLNAFSKLYVIEYLLGLSNVKTSVLKDGIFVGQDEIGIKSISPTPVIPYIMAEAIQKRFSEIRILAYSGGILKEELGWIISNFRVLEIFKNFLSAKYDKINLNYSIMIDGIVDYDDIVFFKKHGVNIVSNSLGVSYYMEILDENVE